MMNFLEQLSLVSFSQYLMLLVAIGFWCNGIYVASENEGDALYWFRNFWMKFPAVIRKPMIECINCMASVHGVPIILIFFFVKDLSWHKLPLTLIVVVVSAAFTNGIFVLLYKSLEWYLYDIQRKHGGKK